MIIGVPKEVKPQEYRVALTPSGARELSGEGHGVLVEESAGAGSGFSDREYSEAGAEIAKKEAVFEKSGLILKVKEPIPSEFPLFAEGRALFTFLHLAPNPELASFLIERKIAAFAYETLEKDGALPLLQPMSEIAGRMSPLVASYFLQRAQGGSGVLPTGAVGCPPANMLIIGAGTVGTNAARTALGIGMRVTVLNRDVERLRHIDEVSSGMINTLPLTVSNVERTLKDTDVAVGAILSTGRKTPVIITKEMLSLMKKGSVLVDVSIDQGGTFETSRPTTHEEPVYETGGILHYAVSNMPGAYPLTSTLALTNRTLPYVKRLASLGVEKALKEDPELKSALNTYRGEVVHRGLKESTGNPKGTI